MGSKYPVLSPKIVIKTLEKYGFRFTSQKGSHMKYSNGDRTVIIPKHTEVAKGTLKSILSMADIPLEDFISKIWKKFPSPPASSKGSCGV